MTGTSLGIGREIAIALARAGADVAVNYRARAGEAEAAAEEIQLLASGSPQRPPSEFLGAAVQCGGQSQAVFCLGESRNQRALPSE